MKSSLGTYFSSGDAAPPDADVGGSSAVRDAASPDDAGDDVIESAAYF